MMTTMMMNMSPWLLLLSLAVTYTASAGPGSCVGRCGESFIRGQRCTCDHSCLQYDECCQDFQAICTSAHSCQGRCSETFRRGRPCECDSQCTQYGTCCHDFQLQCDASVAVSPPRTVHPPRAAASGKLKSQRNKKKSNSESEEWHTERRSCPQHPGAQCPGAFPPPNPLQQGLLPMSNPSSHGRASDWPTSGSSLPSYGAQSAGSSAPGSPSGGGSAGDTNDHMLLSPGGMAPSGPGQVFPGLSGPAGSRPRPSTLQDVVQDLCPSLMEGGPDGPQTGLFEANLCSDSPIDALTALSNGTVLIFRGELFWSVDPVSRSVGCAQNITDTLGVPSPISAAFTRCNCHGNNYIIKGDQYWRLDGNMAMEPGYPKPLASEFPGLTGSISAALAVPATRSRPETVYFFKNGDIMQKFTFPAKSAPPCKEKPRSSFQRRPTRQAVLSGGEINIKVSLKGFPTPVTSALSMPSPLRSDRYKHFVFSGPLFFSIQISGDLPVLAKPDPSAPLTLQPFVSPAAAATSSADMATQDANPTLPANSIRAWLRCP